MCITLKEGADLQTHHSYSILLRLSQIRNHFPMESCKLFDLRLPMVYFELECLGLRFQLAHFLNQVSSVVGAWLRNTVVMPE